MPQPLPCRENHKPQSEAQMLSAEAHVGRGGGGVCIICSGCQVVIVACCFIPLFSIPLPSGPDPEIALDGACGCAHPTISERQERPLRARERILLLSSSTNGPLRRGVGGYNHHAIGEEDGVEASVVVCLPLRPPCPSQPEKSLKIFETMMKRTHAVRTRCDARCTRCAYLPLCFSQHPPLHVHMSASVV